jgi:hypothetical protein
MSTERKFELGLQSSTDPIKSGFLDLNAEVVQDVDKRIKNKEIWYIEEAILAY